VSAGDDARAGGHDPDDADLQLGGMRALFREMRDATDEEPAPGGLDALMAAARAQVQAPARVAASASVVTTRPGLLARMNAWLGALARQPAFAGAAMLVVVASVGGVLYLRGGAKVAGQEAAPTRRTEALPAASPPPTGGLERATATLEQEAPPGAPAATTNAAGDTLPAASPVSPAARPATRSPARPPAKIASDDAVVLDPALAAPVTERAPADAPAFGEAVAAAGPRKAVSGTGVGGASAGAADGDVLVRTEKPRAPGEPAAAVRAAAARGDCATARKLAAPLSASVRDALIANDASVRRCLQTP
jgi:hypothetical protein